MDAWKESCGGIFSIWAERRDLKLEVDDGGGGDKDGDGDVDDEDDEDDVDFDDYDEIDFITLAGFLCSNWFSPQPTWNKYLLRCWNIYWDIKLSTLHSQPITNIKYLLRCHDILKTPGCNNLEQISHYRDVEIVFKHVLRFWWKHVLRYWWKHVLRYW